MLQSEMIRLIPPPFTEQHIPPAPVRQPLVVKPSAASARLTDRARQVIRGAPCGAQRLKVVSVLTGQNNGRCAQQ